jgi:hypothetical protein
VPIAATFHLPNKKLVPKIKRREFACPSHGLGVLPVTRLVEHMDVPEAVQFPMFAEKMLATEKFWTDVPDSQSGSPASPERSRGEYPRQRRTGIRG